MVATNVGVVIRVACGLGVHGESVSGLLSLPFLDQGMDCVNQSMLGDGVEKTNEVIVGSV